MHLTLEEDGRVTSERSSNLHRSKDRIVVDRPLPPPSMSVPESTRIVVNTSEEVEGLFYYNVQNPFIAICGCTPDNVPSTNIVNFTNF